MICVIEKSKQVWRNRLADKVLSGEYVVFAGGKSLTSAEVLTSDVAMVDMVYIAREEMEAAGNNPQRALQTRMSQNRSGSDILEKFVASRMQAEFTIPIFRQALGGWIV